MVLSSSIRTVWCKCDEWYSRSGDGLGEAKDDGFKF